MANRTEMIAWLKANHPNMCNFQDIDKLPTDTPSPAGGNSVHKLFIEHHGGPTTWSSLTPSEQKAVNDAYNAIRQIWPSIKFDLSSMQNGWVYFGKYGISSGGVVSYDGHPYTKDKELMCCNRTIQIGVTEWMNH